MQTVSDARLHDRAQALRHAHAEALLELDAQIPFPSSDAGETAARLVAGDPALLALVPAASPLAAALAE